MPSMEDLVDPPWYDADFAATLTGLDWDYATSMGRSSASASGAGPLGHGFDWNVRVFALCKGVHGLG